MNTSQRLVIANCFSEKDLFATLIEQPLLHLRIERVAIAEINMLIQRYQHVDYYGNPNNAVSLAQRFHIPVSYHADEYRLQREDLLIVMNGYNRFTVRCDYSASRQKRRGETPLSLVQHLTQTTG